MYPEIRVFNTNFEEEIAQKIKDIIPTSICEQIQNCSRLEEKIKIINNFIDSQIGKITSNWSIYPDVKKIQDEIALEIIMGKYKGQIKPKNISSVFTTYKEPLQYRLFYEPNRDDVVLNILKDNYINGKSYSNKFYTTTDGKSINLSILSSNNTRLSGLSSDFLKFIQKTETIAKEFANLATLSRQEISSAVMTRTWRTSGLTRDLGNATGYHKDWSLVKQVWPKIAHPETTIYPTSKLIDTYLLNMYKAGLRTPKSTNPLEKYLKNPSMDKSKILLLKRLYMFSKDLSKDKYILTSNDFLEFKAKFDLEGIGNAIESIEKHYKNVFFKDFWTPERILRFTEALNQNIETAHRNIEVSEDILLQAIDIALT